LTILFSENVRAFTSAREVIVSSTEGDRIPVNHNETMSTLMCRRTT
jgi:hypothetical protein